MVAAACFIAWKEPIGTPNCFRCLLYSTASSSILAAAPRLSAATSTAARRAAVASTCPPSRSRRRPGAAAKVRSAADRVRSRSFRPRSNTPAWLASTRNSAQPPSARGRGVAQLLGGQREFEQATTLAASLFAEPGAQPALGGQARLERPDVIVAQPLADGSRGRVGGQPFPERIAEHLLLRRQLPSHACSSPLVRRQRVSSWAA